MTTIEIPPRSVPSRWRVRAAQIGIAMLCFVLAAVAFGPLVWPPDPLAQNVANRLAQPSLTHPLGTDQFGRDLLARTLAGGRWSIGGAAAVTLASALGGFAIAALAVTSGRWVDASLARITDALFALPSLIIAFALIGAFGTGFPNLVLALSIAALPTYARVYRLMLKSELAQPYVLALCGIGVSPSRLILHHLAPNIAGPAIVVATASFGGNVLNLAALSFLGLGIQPPEPEWGVMANEARRYFQVSSIQMIAPGAAIFVTVVGINLAGDAIRDHLDPKSR